MEKKIVLLVGESATGKTEIEKILGEKGLHRAISYTSRPMRSNESNGSEYFFVDNNEIEKMLKEGSLFELTKYYVRGNLWQYALGRKSFDFSKTNVATVNPHGMHQLLEKDEIKDKIIIFKIETDTEERYKRYMNRETSEHKEENWKERLKQDIIDFVEQDPFQNLENVIRINNDGSLTIQEVADDIYNKIKEIENGKI